MNSTIGIVGCGSAGSRHAQALLTLGIASSAITGYDVKHAPTWPGEVVVEDTDYLVRRMTPCHDIWVIASPAVHHVWQCEALANRPTLSGVLIEKPLGVGRLSGDQIRIGETFAARDIVVQVGYCWRFHPAVQAAQAWVESRASFPDVTATGLSAFDMSTWPGRQYARFIFEGSHELDTMLHLFGRGKVVHIDRRRVDARVITIEHLIGATSTVEIRNGFDGYRRALALRDRAGTFEWTSDDPSVAGHLAYGPLLPRTPWCLQDMYVDQMRSFLEAVDGREMVGTSWDEAAEVLEWCVSAE